MKTIRVRIGRTAFVGKAVISPSQLKRIAKQTTKTNDILIVFIQAGISLKVKVKGYSEA